MDGTSSFAQFLTWRTMLELKRLSNAFKRKAVVRGVYVRKFAEGCLLYHLCGTRSRLQMKRDLSSEEYTLADSIIGNWDHGLLSAAAARAVLARAIRIRRAVESAEKAVLDKVKLKLYGRQAWLFN